MQLVKFDKPKNNLVRVTLAELIDDSWLQFQKTRAFNEVEKVCKAGRMMQPSKWP
jgi:hypothetical protein